MLLNNCRLVNYVWIDRGILLTIIYYILKLYDIIQDKTIIIDKSYHNFLNTIFPNLTFDIYTKHRKDNFYFNIRKIIRKQDVIIDYIKNYEYIETDRVSLVPWYDMNDILVSYYYIAKEKYNISKYAKYVDTFSKCRRGNYNNMIWDLFIETNILNRYILFNSKINIKYLLNRYVSSTFTNTVVNTIQYVEKPYNYIETFSNNIEDSQTNPTIPPTNPTNPTNPTIPPTFPPTLPPTIHSTIPPTFPPTLPPTMPPTMPPTLPPTLPPTNPKNPTNPTMPPTFPPILPPTNPTNPTKSTLFTTGSQTDDLTSINELIDRARNDEKEKCSQTISDISSALSEKINIVNNIIN